MKFYQCAHCGNIITHFRDSGVRVVCCGEQMKELVPGTTDGAVEKHLPVVKLDGSKVTVTVGSVEHPMVEAHFIGWIVLETRQGFQKKDLKPGDRPVAEFILTDGDEAVAAYEFCNLHGLWKTV